MSTNTPPEGESSGTDADELLEQAREAVENGDVEVPPDPAADFPMRSGFLRGAIGGSLGGVMGLAGGFALGVLTGSVAVAMVVYLLTAAVSYRMVMVEVLGDDPWIGEPRTPHVVRVLDKWESESDG